MTPGCRTRQNSAVYGLLSSLSVDWFAKQFPESSFNGRFQIGYRRKGEGGVWPLFMGDRTAVISFLEGMYVSPTVDYYITANSFSGTTRCSEQLFSLHNIVLDIDSHDAAAPLSDELIDEVLMRLDRDLFSFSFPPYPTSIIKTGRGLQLWWSIDPVSIKCRPWYEEIRDTMAKAIEACLREYTAFAGLSVDSSASKNLAGYFRLPGTKNTTVGVISRTISCSWAQYSTHTLLPLAKEWASQQKVLTPAFSEADFSGRYRSSDVCLLKTFRTTAFFRVHQMVKLRLLRDREIGDETRNNLCLIVYNTLLTASDAETAWTNLLLFNAGFKQPMTEKELHHTIDTSLRKQGYWYKNKTVINFLGITPEEQQAIGLVSPSKPYSPFTRLSSHPERRALSKTIKDDRDAKIKQLAETGMSKSKIAQSLEISRTTVGKILGQAPDRRTWAEELLEQGLSTREVADKTGLTIRTIQLYKKRTAAKTA